METTGIVAQINLAVFVIAEVGLAVLSIVVVWKAYRWFCSAVDAEFAKLDEAEDEDDVSRIYDDGGALACENCDYELDEDGAINALENGYCPKCGHEVSY